MTAAVVFLVSLSLIVLPHTSSNRYTLFLSSPSRRDTWRRLQHMPDPVPVFCGCLLPSSTTCTVCVHHIEFTGTAMPQESWRASINVCGMCRNGAERNTGGCKECSGKHRPPRHYHVCEGSHWSPGARPYCSPSLSHYESSRTTSRT